jgi:hypothetical protein
MEVPEEAGLPDVAEEPAEHPARAIATAMAVVERARRFLFIIFFVLQDIGRRVDAAGRVSMGDAPDRLRWSSRQGLAPVRSRRRGPVLRSADAELTR